MIAPRKPRRLPDGLLKALADNGPYLNSGGHRNGMPGAGSLGSRCGAVAAATIRASTRSA